MQHNSNEEREILEVYNKWLYAYLNGDIETYSYYLDDDYHFIGSTNNEEFLTKEETTRFFAATADQLNGKTEIRNNKRTVEYFEGLYFITEVLDAYFLSDGDWTYYGRFRFSSVLQKKTRGWRFIYQHFSTPDIKAQEGETIGYAQVSEDNLKLREAIKRRTVELEQKNRELEIETALEKVRARTMAMQNSSELKDAAALLFQQVKALGVPAFSCGYNIWEKDEDKFTSWMSSNDGTGINPALSLPLTGDANFIRFRESRQRGEDFYVLEMRGERMQEHYRFLSEKIPVFRELFENMVKAGQSLPETQIHHIANFSHGNVMFITFEPCPDAHTIFRRFAKVFEQTYTRFLDLEKAEAQTREAQIEAALEKVRSRSLAMHSTKELGDVVTVIVEKLTDLGVVLDINGVVLCTYFRDSKDVMHWIAAPDLSMAGSYLLPYFDHPIFNDAWQSKENGDEYFSKAFSVEEKNSFFKYAFEHSDYKYFPDEFKQWIFQNDKHILSFAWQKNSAILIPSHTGVLPTENDKAILVRFSKVFEQAYVRFLDLKKAEAQALQAEQDLIAIKEAKQKAEQALTDLQSAQKQLIQAEKMASLGELTAGIAHEIQNPLNFVNNFSEVNKELLAEMREEIEKGNLDEVRAIINDMFVNEEKISEHGRRADAIVKGMLQHSRSSSGEKEPTNINALADEYLRLAYHGLKAKDNTFNATIKTDFDQSIGNINIIPQEIGRVLLNLINNAFYAVNERSKEEESGYEPIVTVTTEMQNAPKNSPISQFANSLIISVRDNGNGIPEKIRNKIFQPFFTTKPTGEGTGLGLSLSYDIVKAHGGELRVESTEDEGSVFSIFLPL